MKTKIKYAQSPVLKWQTEDFDGAVESMLDAEEISQDTATKMLSLEDSEKLELIQSAIGTISSHLCEIIFESICDEIKMY